MRSSLVSRAPALLLAWTAAAAGCGDDETGTVTDSGTTAGSTTEVETTAGTSDASSDGTTVGETDTGETDTDTDTGGIVCVADPPPEATLRPGAHQDGPTLSIGGRELAPAGPNVVVDGFAGDVITHPLANVAYVSVTGHADRQLLVFDLDTHALVQTIERAGAFFGLELAQDGSRLYASGGSGDVLEYYDVEIDGTLTKAGELAFGGYSSGLALSPDGATLWIGSFEGTRVEEYETATMTKVRNLTTGHGVWDVVHVDALGQLYASDLEGEVISVIDLAAGEVVDTLEIPTSPAGMVAHPDGSRVWAAISGADTVVAIDTASRQVVAEGRVAELDLVDMDGVSLANSNVNALSYDAATDRLYAARGADNAVSVLEGDTLALQGAIPASYYPAGVALSADLETLVIAEGKGGGTGPNDGESAKQRWKGSVTFVDLPSVDLAAATDDVIAHFQRPVDVFDFECEGEFPVPTGPEKATPIEHVILIVKENKTFDCVFGDLDPDEHDVDVDPSLVRWGEQITPNLHALARRYAISDSFFVEAPNSDTGHLWLTATHLTEYVERVYLENDNLSISNGYPVTPPATPDVGNFFTHLMDLDVSLRIYGEIVGMLAQSKMGKGGVFQHSDAGYPGGTFINYDVKDEDKGAYVADRIKAGQLATFTYLALPNDHTVGTQVGKPTPESMVADNDYAVGIVVDALSKSPFWEKSVVFIVQDDPQSCDDHVDALRAFALVVGPWARREYVSHAHASFLSVFATVERILGVPPIGRPDAAAAPMWDMFTQVPDLTPYDALPRQIPEEVNSIYTPGATRSAQMDFEGPDRNPELGALLDAYRLWRMGKISKAEAEARIAAPKLDRAERAELEEEAREEREEYEEALAAYQALQMLGEVPAGMALEDDDDDDDD